MDLIGSKIKHAKKSLFPRTKAIIKYFKREKGEIVSGFDVCGKKLAYLKFPCRYKGKCENCATAKFH